MSKISELWKIEQNEKKQARTLSENQYDIKNLENLEEALQEQENMSLDDFQKIANTISVKKRMYKKTEKRFYFFHKDTLYTHFYNDLFIDAYRTQCYKTAEYLLKNNLTEKDAFVFSDLHLFAHVSVKNRFFHLTHLATAEQDVITLDLLQKYGADFSLTTDAGETPEQMYKRIDRNDRRFIAKMSAGMGSGDIYACTGMVSTTQSQMVNNFFKSFTPSPTPQRIVRSHNPTFDAMRYNQNIHKK